MELTFLTAALREVCEKRAVAVANLGYAAARELSDRLADIQAVDSVDELSQLLGQAISDKSATEKALRLDTGHEILFSSAHPLAGKAPSEMTDWTKTSRMKILAIEPTNE